MTILHIERFQFTAVAVEVDFAIGQHAIHVQQQTPDAFEPFLKFRGANHAGGV